MCKRYINLYKKTMVHQAFERLTQEIQEQDLFLIKWQLK